MRPGLIPELQAEARATAQGVVDVTGKCRERGPSTQSLAAQAQVWPAAPEHLSEGPGGPNLITGWLGVRGELEKWD